MKEENEGIIPQSEKSSKSRVDWELRRTKVPEKTERDGKKWNTGHRGGPLC